MYEVAGKPGRVAKYLNKEPKINNQSKGCIKENNDHNGIRIEILTYLLKRYQVSDSMYFPNINVYSMA